MKTTLVSAQQKLAPVKANLDKALQAVAAAEKPIAELDKKIAGLRQQAAASEAAAKADHEAAAKFDQQLPALSTSIRDLQDEMTALRVALKKDPSKMIAVAEVEEKLAGKLLDLAKQRRTRIDRDQSIAKTTQAAKTQKAEADKLAATRPALEKKLADAKTLADAARAAHDDVAKVVSAVQSKMDRLLAEIK